MAAVTQRIYRYFFKNVEKNIGIEETLEKID